MISIQLEVCGMCGACVAVCRANALFLHNTALCVSELCNGCGSCVRICPLRAIVLEQGRTDHGLCEREL